MYCGYITSLKNVRKHSNADRLQVGECFGNNVIVDLSYKEGDIGLYLPVDGRVSKEFGEANNLFRIKNEDGTYSGGYLNADKRNITALRLRGEKSDGLFLPLKSLEQFANIDKLALGEQITVLNGVLICEKYIPRRNSSNPTKANKKTVNKSKELVSYPLFQEHLDTAQLAYNMGAFKEGDTVYLTLKMHGCFKTGTRVKLWGKSRAKKIEEIQKGDIVVGMRDGKLVPTSVLETFNNGKTKQWQELKIERRDLAGEQYSRIICTPNHLFYDAKDGSYRKAKDLKADEDFFILKQSHILTRTHKEILLGILLGDGHYNKNKGSIEFSQKLEKEEYLQYIKNIFGDFVILQDKIYTSGYGTKMKRGRTRYCADLKNYFATILSESGENKLTEKIIEDFSWLSLAFLYMDDGSLLHTSYQSDRMCLAICDYNNQDGEIIVKCLEKLGLSPVFYTDSEGYNRIRINKDDADFAFSKIQEYIPEAMRYKLPERYRSIDGFKGVEYQAIENGYVFIPTKIISNEEINSSQGSVKYDLHTETNNYVVGETLVHNSSGRTGNLIEEIKPKRRLFQRLLHIKPKTKKSWKCVSGTRRTVLKNFTGGYYGNDAFREKYHSFFKDKLPKGMTVYYEIVGYVNETTPIMSTCSNKKLNDKEFVKQYGETTVFNYGCGIGQNDCYVYRITMTNEDGYVVELPWEQVQIECEKLGVKCVPTFEKFIFTTKEDLMERVNKYVDGADSIGLTHIREGVVVRIDNREKFAAYKHKSFTFKILEGIIKTDATEPDLEEAEEVAENE